MAPGRNIGLLYMSRTSVSAWEIGYIKNVFHTFDASHAGSLSRRDLTLGCEALGLDFTREQLHGIFEEMDESGDGEISLEEFVTWLSKSHSESGEAALLQAKIGNRDACICGGSAFGLLHCVGWFFADPIRLFRDSYVEYFALIKAKVAHRTGIAMGQVGVVDAVRNEARAMGMMPILKAISVAIAIDSFIGISMFTSYCWSKAWLAKSGLHRMQLELTAGAMAGGVCGTLNCAVNNLTDQQRTWDRSWNQIMRSSQALQLLKPWVLFQSLHRFLLRDMFGHALFFATFNGGKRAGAGLMACLRIKRNTLRDASVTVCSGALAGASYRVATVPLTQLWKWHAEQPAPCHSNSVVHFLRTVKPGARLPLLYRGLGESLRYSMPVSGLAFLFYELAIIRHGMFGKDLLSPLQGTTT